MKRDKEQTAKEVEENRLKDEEIRKAIFIEIQKLQRALQAK